MQKVYFFHSVDAAAKICKGQDCFSSFLGKAPACCRVCFLPLPSLHFIRAREQYVGMERTQNRHRLQA